MARICSELTFDITATNGVGRSTPGRVSGGFPLGKSSLPSEYFVCMGIVRLFGGYGSFVWEYGSFVRGV